MGTHTQGPFRVERRMSDRWIVPVDGSTGSQPLAIVAALCEAYGGAAASDANAALFATSDEMLDVLESVMARWDKAADADAPELGARLRRVVARARGEVTPLSTFERVKNILVEHLGVDEDKVSPEARLVEDLGADSLDEVELVMAAEDEFAREITDDEAEGIKTVADVVALIALKLVEV